MPDVRRFPVTNTRTQRPGAMPRLAGKPLPAANSLEFLLRSITSMLEGHTVDECAVIKAEQLCARCTVTEWTDGLGNTYTVTDPPHMMADGKCMEISVTAVDSYQQPISTEDSYPFYNPFVRVWVDSVAVEDPNEAIRRMVARAVLDVNQMLGK